MDSRKQIAPGNGRSDTPRARLRALALPLLSGGIFLGIFALQLARIPPGSYQDRDDAIITLSHARNLVEFGSIGVNPAGERVEGFSAPAEFLLFTAVYALSGSSYHAFFGAQSAVCAFLLGFLFFGFFRHKPAFGLALSGGAAWLLARDSSFLEWHASGMENPLIHVLFLLGLRLLHAMLETGRIRYLYCLPLFLACIGRIESVFHVAPVLGLFAVYWRETLGGWKALGFSALTGLLWGLFQLGRYAYFGELLPNTAVAQGISVLGRLGALAGMDPSVIGPAAGWAAAIFEMHQGPLLLAALFLSLFTKRDRAGSFLCLALGSLFLTACLTPFVFGQARLDVTRTTTHLALCAVLAAAAAVYRAGPRGLILALLPVLLPAAQPYPLDYSAEPFLRWRAELREVRDRHLLFRPQLLNVDLGAMSWAKDFNILDMGRIGSAIASRLHQEAQVREYVFEIAAPDLIELHTDWACAFCYLFRDRRFAERYEQVREMRDAWQLENCSRCAQARTGIWIRKDMALGSPSRERLLMDRLAAAPEAALPALEAELERCAARGGLRDCLYVTRTAYRFLPELRRLGLERPLLDLFRRSPSADYDLALLGAAGRAGWHRAAVAFVLRACREGD